MHSSRCKPAYHEHLEYHKLKSQLTFFNLNLRRAFSFGDRPRKFDNRDPHFRDLCPHHRHPRCSRRETPSLLLGAANRLRCTRRVATYRSISLPSFGIHDRLGMSSLHIHSGSQCRARIDSEALLEERIGFYVSDQSPY